MTGPLRWPDWRLYRGWTTAELEARLADVPRLSSTAPRSEADALDPRWRHYHSEAVIAREPPGPPVAGGPFSRSKTLIALYAFSDPRIVSGHFDPQHPLPGRPMLLELKSVGGRFLCAVRVGAVRDQAEIDETTWGFRYDTCAGHIEAGWEWFLLSKRHETGEIWFRIQAVWHSGEFPNLLTRAGFALVARWYQRAWHRLAYVRLRRMLETDQQPRRNGMTPGAGSLWAVLGMGALCGVRSMAGPVVLTRYLAGRGKQPVWRMAAQGFTAAAALEAAADKLPNIPARTSAVPLTGRAMFGAACGYFLPARRTEDRVLRALVGAASAVAATFGIYYVRRFLTTTARLPNGIAGALEDVAVLSAGRSVARLLR